MMGAGRPSTDRASPPIEVMDLIPVKPLGEEEANIRNIYRTKLQGLYGKLKGRIILR
jgi:hypothetical protein